MKFESKNALEDEIFGQGVDIGVAQRELRLLGNIGRAIRRALWVILAGSFIGGAIGYALSYTREVRYTSVAQVMIDTRVSSDTEFTPFITGLPTSVTALESELEVLRSIDLIERVVDDLGLQDDPEFYQPDEEGAELIAPTADTEEMRRETTIANVADRTMVEQIGNISAVYAIRFTSESPRKSATLANSIAQEYLETTMAAKLRSLELSQGWLTERTEELQSKLSDLGVRLEQHLLSAPYSLDEIETTKARSVSAERRLTQIEEEIELIGETLEEIKVLQESGEIVAAARLVDQPSSELTAALQAVEAREVGAEGRLADALVAEARLLDRRREWLGGEVEPLREETETTRAILIEQARRDAVTRRIENDIAVSEAIYQDFVSQLSRRTQQNEYLDADARIISLARPPLDPSEPRRTVYAAVGIMAAGFLLSMMVILREIFQSRMRSIHEFESGTGLPMIGITPEMPKHEAPFLTFFGDSGEISPALMRFARKLRLSILADLPEDAANYSPESHWVDSDWGPGAKGGAKSRKPGASGSGSNAVRMTIAGASSSIDDGQSSSMLALACAFADSGERVLLLDADFSGSRYSPLASPEAEELEYILNDPRKSKQHIVETMWPRFSILPAPLNAEKAAQRIGLVEWRRLLRHLSSQYDRILIDTPPLTSKIDTAVLHQAADAVVLLARWNSTKTGEIHSILKVLGDVGVTPIAVIATRMRLDKVRKYGDDALFYLGRSMAA